MVIKPQDHSIIELPELIRPLPYYGEDPGRRGCMGEFAVMCQDCWHGCGSCLCSSGTCKCIGASICIGGVVLLFVELSKLGLFNDPPGMVCHNEWVPYPVKGGYAMTRVCEHVNTPTTSSMISNMVNSTINNIVATVTGNYTTKMD